MTSSPRDHIAFGHPKTKDPRFRAAAGNAQIKTAAVAIHPRPLLARHLQRSEFADEQHQVSAILEPYSLPTNFVGKQRIAANGHSPNIGQEVPVLKGFLERWRTNANDELAEGVRFELTGALASPAGFQDRCLKPLGHPSNALIILHSCCSKNRL